jgi:hypothetical protein
MEDDPRQIISDQLLASELKRKEKLLTTIKSLNLGLGFYATALLLLVTSIVTIYWDKDFPSLVPIFIMAFLLVLLDILSNIRSHQKINALLELIGEEPLRRLARKTGDEDPDADY